jgi:hypothetical protein
LSKQFANGRRICFIVDQLNALDVKANREDNISNEKKAALLEFLQKVSSRQVYITSASADFKTARYMQKKQTDDEKIPLLGGMTPVSAVLYIYLSPLTRRISQLEISHWWSRHAQDFAAFTQAEKQRVEDLTGCIPLLLAQFLGIRATLLNLWNLKSGTTKYWSLSSEIL